jgi:hypothetical protein
MLPVGVKPLTEIKDLPDSVTRATFLGVLFEHLLRSITPHGKFKDLEVIFRENEPRLKRFQRIDDVRVVRNWIVHGDDRLTTTQVLHAESALQKAIEGILLDEDCKPSLREAIRGIVPPSSPAADHSRDGRVNPAPPDKPAPAPPLHSSGPTGPTLSPAPESELPPAVPIAAPNPPPTRRPQPPSKPGWLSHPKSWFVLAAAALVLAGVAYLAQPRPQQAQTRGLSGGSGPGSSKPPAPGVQTAMKDPAVDPPVQSRESQFGELINRSLSVSTALPNLAVLIDSSGPPTPGSVGDSLSGFLAGSKVKIINNLADINALKTQGFFDDLYGGNSGFLSKAAQLSRVDYILLGNATYSFRRQAELDPDLTTCDLSLTVRLANRAGTFVQSESFSVTGPGFTQAQALERASENAAQRLKEKILDAIR